MVYIKACLKIIVFLVIIGMCRQISSHNSAYAQSTQAKSQIEQQEALAQQSQDQKSDKASDLLSDGREGVSEPEYIASPVIDLNDPAIQAALEAREKADRALAEAVRAQQKALQQKEAVSSEVENQRLKTAFFQHRQKI